MEAPLGRVVGLLTVRSALPVTLQAAAAAAMFGGAEDPWRESARWWLVYVTIANVVCVASYASFARREGSNVREVLHLGGTTRADIGWAVLALAVSGPLAYFPNVWLGAALFGDPAAPAALVFQELPAAAAWGLFAVFPATQGLAELPTYFGYVMPRLAARWGSRWGAWAVCVAFLSLQHVGMPFLPDPAYVAWRMFMFLPFAAWIGWVVARRPGVLPGLVVGHALLDASLPLLQLPGAMP